MYTVKSYNMCIKAQNDEKYISSKVKLIFNGNPLFSNNLASLLNNNFFCVLGINVKKIKRRYTKDNPPCFPICCQLLHHVHI